MKLLKFLISVLAVSLFSSCLEINEEVEIKSNGSGKLSTTTDISQMIDMMQAMGGEEFDKKKDEKIDTIISMKDYVDTASNLTEEQKKLLRDGKINVKMNLPEKVFKINMQFPFDNLEKLQQLQSAMNSGAGSVGNLMKTVMGEEKQPKEIIDQPVPAEAPPSMEQITGVFDFNVSDGLIKKSLNQEKFKKLLDDPKMAQMQQGAEMGIEVIYNISFTLPRSIKKVSNTTAKISDDKRTVTLRQNLMEIFKTPEKFEFTIEY